MSARTGSKRAPVAGGAVSGETPCRGDRLWSLQDVSDYLGVPVGTLYQWRHRGQGPAAFRLGKHLRFDAVEVRRWVERQVA